MNDLPNYSLTAAPAPASEAVAWQGRPSPDQRWQDVPAEYLSFRRDIQAWEIRPLYATPGDSADAPVQQAVPCQHIAEPRGCYRLRCQLGKKCVEPAQITSVQREAIVRRAVAERDAIANAAPAQQAGDTGGMTIVKAIRQGLRAEPWKSNGPGKPACVGICAIQIESWVHTDESAKAFADAYNLGLDHMRAALKGEQPVEPSGGERGNAA